MAAPPPSCRTFSAASAYSAFAASPDSEHRSTQAQRGLLPGGILPAFECRKERRFRGLPDGRKRVDPQQLVAALVASLAGGFARDEHLLSAGNPSREFRVTDPGRDGRGRKHANAPLRAGPAENPHLAPGLGVLYRHSERVALAIHRRRPFPDDSVGAALRERIGDVALRVHEEDAGLARLSRRRHDSRALAAL